MKNLSVEQTVNKVGETVELYGWVDTKRDHKKIVFIDLRDRTGTVQVVGGEEFKALSEEDVVYIKGLVKARPDKMINSKIKTGSIEIEVKELKILNKTKTLPIPVNTDGHDIDEEVRLKYRYLDLRRPRMYKNLALRSRFIDLIRQHLFKQDFLEIETPILSETTPEGARDFIVPSRLQLGKFYALPQSPQQYKQLLMVGGVEKYFQIARCFRDEDPRADRAYGEFTQLDLEMSFVEREDVMRLTENLFIEVYEKLKVSIKQKPFPVFTYTEAIKKFGADKFDLRTPEEKAKNIQAFAWVVDFPFFEKTKEGGWTFTHNPFSAPKPEFMKDLLNKKNVGNILTTQYDLVCNGYEVGGGSIRNHTPEGLKSVFEIMGLSEEEINLKFGHMIEALGYGAPPHGGIAPGIDRLLTCITGETSIREVIAMPMTSGGRTAIMKAPSTVKDEKLKELGIKLRNSGEKKTTTSKSVFDKIKNLLDENKVVYELIEHKPVFTSEDAAKIRGSSLSLGAKALIMNADKKPIMIVVPGNKKVDTSVFKKLYSIKDLEMAKPEEVKNISGVEIGAVPPLGNLFKIPLYFDQTIVDNETVFFNAGSHSKSISMKGSDLERVTKPIVGEFSK
ncbi:MAG: Aspartyl-tRNA synthetase [Candidatus Roizmanbacteria bacterium GW2011_GWC2_34_23]|uniref:Aspartate--tRNA(Asp/Asn) ligase n=1 Tax=Candidatus Roizmanbacteria bacterium GW2011_GWC2_34_23 TaxID=1618484 RepID=A0A0G0BB34_9BACT|nr:MAG: Aspartyl-tRNA synthetase [Candidatus Roizmanbacteria bacterium GW2011_GWC2_34_23]